MHFSESVFGVGTRSNKLLKLWRSWYDKIVKTVLDYAKQSSKSKQGRRSEKNRNDSEKVRRYPENSNWIWISFIITHQQMKKKTKGGKCTHHIKLRAIASPIHHLIPMKQGAKLLSDEFRIVFNSCIKRLGSSSKFLL